LLNTLVKEYLYGNTTIEELQKKDNKFVMNYPTNAYLNVQNRDLMFIKKFFLKNNFVYISKHPRFADYPKHSHNFLEFNYMLDGECHQIVNGHDIHLKKGELLLMDNNSSHEVKALSKNDILINIIFPNEKFDLDWLLKINNQDSSIFTFLMQDFSERSIGEFIVFKSHCSNDVPIILEQILNNYFTNTIFSNETLRFYIPILLMELIGNTDYTISGNHFPKSQNQTIVKCLRLIELEYDTITLDKLALKLSYNKNYLSNLIKDKTSHTFTELLNEHRLKQACFLLESTEISIRGISNNVGISNINYFYKIFNEKYQMSPRNFRDHQKSSG
jgi:AraC-like DNA-binding protein